MIKSLLYNPFTYIAGRKSLLVGLLVVLFTSFICFTSGTHIIGIATIQFAKNTTFQFYLLEHILSWLILSFLLFIAGLIFSKSKIRIVDIFGTIAIARLPLLLVPLLRLLPSFKSFMAYSFTMYFLLALHVAALIWVVTLTYFAYRVSCNLKGEKLILSFIVVLILSEIISYITTVYTYTLNF